MSTSGKSGCTILDLPSELICLILSYLPSDSFPNLCLTHSFFNEVLRDDFLWRQTILNGGHNRSCLRYFEVPGADNRSRSDDPTMIATVSLTLKSPKPYASYQQLYTQVFKRYGSLIGTWIGDTPWLGSIMEIFYNSVSGRIDCRKIHPYACYGSARTFSLDQRVLWRDFDPVLIIWSEPILELTYSTARTTTKFSTRISRLVALDEQTHDDDIPTEKIWPSKNVPVHDRALEGQPEAWMAVNDGSGDYSENLISLSRPILQAASRIGPGQPAEIPRHTELFCRLPQSLPVPAAFKHYSGLFIGDYSSHTAEVVFLYYPTPTSLHAVKLTGDPNVPRGELSWVVDDLTSPVRTCKEREWPGARAYKGRGQISPYGFSNPGWIEAEIIFYHAKTDRMRHTTQSSMTQEEVDEYVAQNETKGSCRYRVETASVALWWKDMIHMSLFHKVSGASDGARTELADVIAEEEY